jgi:Zn-dependent protease with chaperone function
VIIAATLFGYAVVMATTGAWLLRNATWTTQAPRLAIVAWQTLAVSVLSSALLGAGALSMRLHLTGGDHGGLIHFCVVTLQAAYATPGRAVTTTLAIAVLVAASARATWGVTTTLRRASRQRRRQLELLRLVARRDPELDVLVLDHPAPSAFCLPGRDRSVVVTSTALALLSRSELAAVLAHERAHLRGRHHLLVAFSQGLARAFPGVPVFAWGEEQVRRLVELAADDQACRRHRPSCVANAILLLAESAPPAVALALGAEAIELRLQRLVGRQRPVRRGVHGGLVAAQLVAPAVVVAVLALTTAGLEYC